MSATSEGRAEVEQYYRIAPRIVARVGARPDADAIWRRLAVESVLPAVRSIQAGDPDAAHAIYRRMVRELSISVSGAGPSPASSDGGGGRSAR